MGHEEICDCCFIRHCATFDDLLIDDARKGPEGLGCRQQSDVYRAKHCHVFRCMYMSVVIGRGFQPRADGPAAGPT